MNNKLKEKLKHFFYTEIVQKENRDWWEDCDVLKFIEQNTLTLESKIDENGIVDEPSDWYNWNDTMNPHTVSKVSFKKCEYYENLPNIGQMPTIIRELREENQLQKLQLEAKKSSWISDAENRENNRLKEQLKEKEQRIKEYEQVVEKFYNKHKDEELKPLGFEKIEQLINK